MRSGDFSEVLAFNPDFRIYDPATGDADGAGRSFFDDAIIPANRISDIAKTHPGAVPGAERPGTNNGLQNNLFVPRLPKAIRDNYDGKIELEPQLVAPVLGQVLDDARRRAGPVLPAVSTEAGGGETTVSLWTLGQTWTLTPTLLLDANGGSNKMTHQSSGPDYGTNYGLDTFGIPGTEQRRRHGPGIDRPRTLQRHAGRSRHRAVGARQRCRLDAGMAQGNQLHRIGQPDQGAGPPRNPRAASTSCG